MQEGLKKNSPAGRKLAKTLGLRLYQDQWDWLGRMEAERSVDVCQLMRSALDYYVPVYEAIGDQSDRAQRRRVLDRVEQVLETVPPERVLSVLEGLVDQAIEAAGERAQQEEDAA